MHGYICDNLKASILPNSWKKYCALKKITSIKTKQKEKIKIYLK